MQQFNSFYSIQLHYEGTKETLQWLMLPPEQKFGMALPFHAFLN